MSLEWQLLRMLEPPLRPDGTPARPVRPVQPIEQRDFAQLLQQAGQAATARPDAPGQASDLDAVPQPPPLDIARLAALDNLPNPTVMAVLGRRASATTGRPSPAQAGPAPVQTSDGRALAGPAGQESWNPNSDLYRTARPLEAGHPTRAAGQPPTSP